SSAASASRTAERPTASDEASCRSDGSRVPGVTDPLVNRSSRRRATSLTGVPVGRLPSATTIRSERAEVALGSLPLSLSASLPSPPHTPRHSRGVSPTPTDDEAAPAPLAPALTHDLSDHILTNRLTNCSSFGRIDLRRIPETRPPDVPRGRRRPRRES